MVTRPMLAAKARTLADLQYPCLVQPKIDGLRCLILEGVAWSRAFKRLPNRHLQSLASSLPDGLDGELVAGANFEDAQSACMKYEGEPDIRLIAFDFVPNFARMSAPYKERYAELLKLTLPSWVEPIESVPVDTQEELLAYEAECLERGFEGVCTRDPYGPYKCGRSTRTEGYLFKFKRYEDSEARITGLVEQMHNGNPIVENAFGMARRPGGNALKSPKDTLGAFVVYDPTLDVHFEIGTGKGLTQELRQQIWDSPDQYIGRLVKYTYQELGSQGRPRFPSFQGFREEGT